MHASSKTRPFEDGRSTVGRVEGLDRLDYTIARLENKRLSDWSDTAVGYDKDRTTATKHDWNRDALSCILPSLYSSNSAASLLLEKSKGTSWVQRCKPLWIICLVLLLAWAIIVPLYFAVGPGWLPWKPEAKPIALEINSQINDHLLANDTVLTAVNCTVRIVSQPYTPELADPQTAEFQSTKIRIETLVAVVFQRNDDFDKATITSFTPGTGHVLVRFIVMLRHKRADVRDIVHSTLREHLANNWWHLGQYQLDVNSITVDYIRNPCAVDNGGCSHVCFWSVLSQTGAQCHCPHGYSLMADTVTCFPTMLRRESTTPTTTCAADQFACAGGSCVPSVWLCDTVSDCPLGDDESQAMCALRSTTTTSPLQEQVKVNLEDTPSKVKVKDMSQFWLPTTTTSSTTPSHYELKELPNNIQQHQAQQVVRDRWASLDVVIPSLPPQPGDELQRQQQEQQLQDFRKLRNSMFNFVG